MIAHRVANTVNISAGMRPKQRENLLRRKRNWKEAELAPNPVLPPKKVFKPKFDLPKLGSYKGRVES